MEHRAYVFDTETTGKIAPRLVESALLPMDIVEGVPAPVSPQAVVKRWNPGKKIEPGAWATHFIEDADVANCPPAAKFSLPAHNHYIIGHNVDYDYSIAGQPSNVRRICTLAIAKKLWPEFESHKQLAVLYALNPHMAKTLGRDAHSAGADVLMCAEILRQAALHLRNLGVVWSSWEDVWKFSERARVPETMPFGKHKGTPINELPGDYIIWALNNLKEMDPYLRKALENAA